MYACELKPSRMSKRRRTSSIASRGQEEDSLDSIEATTSGGPPRKRSKKQDPVYMPYVNISVFLYVILVLDGTMSAIV